MFGRRKKDSGGPTPPQAAPTGPIATDPLEAARRMSDVVFDTFVKPLKLQRGLASPVIAATIGALAGHACQVATVSGIANGNPDYRGLSIMTADGKNGDRYLVGDAINRPVLDWQYSVWALVAGITEKMGIPTPDVRELAGYVASTMGGDTFGIPRDLPAGAPTPRAMLSLWGLGDALAKDVPHPDYVPVTFTLAYQRLVQTDHAADPTVDLSAMARIVMESALAMSKLQATPADLGQQTAAAG